MKPITPIAALWVLVTFACTGISPATAPPTYTIEGLLHRARVAEMKLAAAEEAQEPRWVVDGEALPDLRGAMYPEAER